MPCMTERLDETRSHKQSINWQMIRTYYYIGQQSSIFQGKNYQKLYTYEITI